MQYGRGTEGNELIDELNWRPPGVLVYRNGSVVDEEIPFTDQSQLLEWLDVHDGGKLTAEFAYRRAAAAADGWKISARLVLADRLQRIGLADEADIEFAIALSEWASSTFNSGVDSPHTPSALEHLRLYDYALMHPQWPVRARAAALRSPEVLDRLIAARDKLFTHVEQDSAAALRDRGFFRLIEVLSAVPDVDRLDAFLRKLAQDEQTRRAVDGLRQNAFFAFAKRELWEAAGRIVDRPLGWLGRAYGSIAMMEAMSDAPNPRQGPAKKLFHEREGMLIELGSTLYASLLAAQRDRDAMLVSETLLSFVDSAQTRRELVRTALRAGQPRSEQVKWADEADSMEPGSEKLRPILDEALRARDHQTVEK
jgi:hypothetical protein